MILVVDKSKRNASSVADMFFYMGILAKATTVQESFAEISDIYRAVVIISPESLPDAEDYIKRLQTYNSSVPFFAIGEPSYESRELFCRFFHRGTYASSVMSGILEYTLDKGLPQPGDYKLAGMDLSCDIPVPTYFWTPFPLTKTEAMIVKYLIRTYPEPTTAEDILKYAYKDSRTPEISNIRTHISIINKKFRNLTNRNLIEMSFGKGYRVMTPELLEATI